MASHKDDVALFRSCHSKSNRCRWISLRGSSQRRPGLAFRLFGEVIFLTNIITQQISTKDRHCVREELEALVRLALNEVSIAEFRDHVDQIGSSVGVPCRHVAMDSIIRAYTCTFMYEVHLLIVVVLRLLGNHCCILLVMSAMRLRAEYM